MNENSFEKKEELVFDASLEESDLTQLAQKVLREINLFHPFILWLNGEMGSGKTTLTRHLLRALGLPEIIPVSSPTFSYVNEYKIGNKEYAHMDLFRADGSFDVDDLGVGADRAIDGYFVEWPDLIARADSLAPTHRLDIEYGVDEGRRMVERHYRFYRYRLPLA